MSKLKLNTFDKSYVTNFYNFQQETRTDLEYTLIRIEGLISLVVDVEHQRVTMRTLINVTPKQIAEAIKENNPNMEARLVTRNKYNQEFLVRLVS